MDLFVFVVTDILTNDSVVVASGQAAQAVEKAFNVTLADNTATLKGVVSRKKQIVLAAIAGVDADSYGLDMLKAGADLSAKTIPQLLSLDAKEFTMGSHKVEIAQVNTVDTNDVLSRKEEVIETSDPLYYRAEPVGCTATILNKLYKENGVEIKKDIAGLMLSAIISDSLLFKSPTCTEEDVKAAKEIRLGEINGETEYALKKFNAEVPRLVNTVANETDSVILVDHNERQQSVDDLDQVRVLEVIDHHRIANPS
ncbi:hypothetical protein DT075_06700 [Bacillus licheniformis]|nr:hypothetical protein DT075_06700 [Bacillus licheniformis]